MLSVKVKSRPSCGMLQVAHGLEHALGARAATAPVGVDEDERELLAAVARDKIHAPRQPFELGGERPEDPVAEGVAVGVVDLLEVIDVQQQQRERRRVALAALEFGLAAAPGTCGGCRGR